MTDELEVAYRERDRTFQRVQMSERRTSELADEFTRLEVQISALLLTFLGLFMPWFLTETAGISLPVLVLLKALYVLSVSMIVLSLAVGLIHIKRKERFWDAAHISQIACLKKWRDVCLHGGDLEETLAFMKGVSAGQPDISRTPMWTWVLQTSLLALGFVFILGLFLVLLFCI